MIITFFVVSWKILLFLCGPCWFLIIIGYVIFSFCVQIILCCLEIYFRGFGILKIVFKIYNFLPECLCKT